MIEAHLWTVLALETKDLRPGDYVMDMKSFTVGAVKWENGWWSVTDELGERVLWCVGESHIVFRRMG